jgi:hypothetical protein
MMPHWMQIELAVIFIVTALFVGWLSMLANHADTGIVDRESVYVGIVAGGMSALVVTGVIDGVQSLLMFTFGWTR